MRMMINKSIENAIKKRIEHRINHQKPLSPYDLLMYRSHYYEQAGTSNYNRIIKEIEQDLTCAKEKNDNYTSSLFSRLFLNKLFELKCQGKLKLIGSRNMPDKPISDDEIYLFFDSYLFFNGGHTGVAEQTIDNLQLTNSGNAIFVFLLDKNMMLFPSLSKLIIDKCNSIIAFDATKFPIKLAQTPSPNNGIKKLSESFQLDNECSMSLNDCIFNPSVSWKNYPYRFKGFPKKAWSSAFSKEESIEITKKVLHRLKQKPLTKDYVAIHARNSILMSDNVRNTKPLIERKQLFEGLITMGLQVLVLGIMEPDSKFRHPDMLYSDELGPISDDIQIHIIHGAIGLIGSPSGVTQLTYCTDTPTLLLDMPFPFCTCYPNSNMKALLKKLEKSGENISLSKYYEYTQSELVREEVRDSEGKPFSPLRREGIELKCNSDAAVLHAFQELLLDTYSASELKNLAVEPVDSPINVEAFAKDYKAIHAMLKTCKKDSDNYPYFEMRDLSKANWLRD